MKWWLRALTTCILFLSRFSSPGSHAHFCVFINSVTVIADGTAEAQPIHLNIWIYAHFILYTHLALPLIPTGTHLASLNDTSYLFKSNSWGPDRFYAPIQLIQAHSCTLDLHEETGLRHALCMIEIEERMIMPRSGNFDHPLVLRRYVFYCWVVENTQGLTHPDPGANR